MSIWAIADIHASATEPTTGRPIKSMDVFGAEWQDHVERLERSWQRSVQPADTVIVAGDIDWALRLADAMETLERIDSWNGRKVLIRGNHDYWWSSKTTNKVRRVLPPSVSLLHNEALQVDGFNICGAKGSPVPGGIDWTEENAKLLNREVQRLETSLAARDPGLPTVVALHYPPFYPAHGTSPYREAIERSGAAICVFGHLHGTGAGGGPRGRIGSVEYRLVAADALDFQPDLVTAGNQVVMSGPRQPGESKGKLL